MGWFAECTQSLAVTAQLGQLSIKDIGEEAIQLYTACVQHLYNMLRIPVWERGYTDCIMANERMLSAQQYQQ